MINPKRELVLSAKTAIDVGARDDLWVASSVGRAFLRPPESPYPPSIDSMQTMKDGEFSERVKPVLRPVHRSSPDIDRDNTPLNCHPCVHALPHEPAHN